MGDASDGPFAFTLFQTKHFEKLPCKSTLDRTAPINPPSSDPKQQTKDKLRRMKSSRIRDW